MLEKIVGVNIQQGNEGVMKVGGLEGKSFQYLLTTLPIKLGGLGLREQLKLSLATYVAGLEQALPFFGGEGICPTLAYLGGGC